MRALRAARHEPRLVVGLLLTVTAIAYGLVVFHQAKSQVSRDFAACIAPRPAADCSLVDRPITTGWTISSSDGFRRRYYLAVATSASATLSLNGLSHRQIAPFLPLDRAPVMYRHGRLVAVGTGTGESLRVPLELTKALFLRGGLAALIALAGLGLATWGLIRLNRPHGPLAAGQRR